MAEKEDTNTDSGDEGKEAAAKRPATQPASKPVGEESAQGSAAGSGQPAVDRTRSKQASRQKPRKRRGKVLVYLVLLVLLVAAGFYLWYQHGDRIRPWVQPLIALFQEGEAKPAPETEDAAPPVADQQPVVPSAATPPEPEPTATAAADEPDPQVSQLRQRLEEIDQRSTDRGEKVAEVRHRLAEIELTLNRQQKRLEALATVTREDWLLAEAEFLLRLANQRILTDSDSRNALSLLESADAILQELDDPDLYPLRRTLADDITRLRVAGSVDREGIYLALDSLIGLIPDLAFPVSRQEPDKTAEAPAPDATWYWKLAANAWHALKKLSGIVRVEKANVAADPRLLPSEQKLVRTNLRLALEQAQLALLREEQVIYDASLQQARELLGQAEQNRVSAGMAEELAALADREVTVELPRVTDSIRTLRDYTAHWHDRYRIDDEPGTGSGSEAQAPDMQLPEAEVPEAEAAGEELPAMEGDRP